MGAVSEVFAGVLIKVIFDNVKGDMIDWSKRARYLLSRLLLHG